jgi:pSer/pThr/pTyr-binding forkhead associated (FHA) protein
VHTRAELVVRKGEEELERLPIGEHVVSVFGRSVTADVPCEHASISRRHCALVQHVAGGFCVVDLGSTHGTFLNGQRLLPHAEVAIGPADLLSVGASTRTYALRGLTQASHLPGNEPGARSVGAANSCSDDDDDEEEEGADAMHDAADAGGGAAADGRSKRKKRKWEKKAVRRLRQVVVPRGLTENERVALRAGAGSGCFGPG